MSETKFKVRYSALLLKEFTVADIIKATNLNPESVRTELQRMRQEGLLISSPHPDKQKKRGGHPSVYRLADDPDRLLELSASVEAFYPPEASTKPTSRFYKLAKHSIDQALVSDHPMRFQLLSNTEADLDMAFQAEGGNLATNLIKAYLEYERARLVYLRDDNILALKMFEELLKFFVEKRIDSVVKRIDEYIMCLKASISFVNRESSRHRNAEWARCLLDTLKENDFETESPLTVLLLDLLRDLSISPDKELISSIVREVIDANSLRDERSEITRIQSSYSLYQENQVIGFSSEQSSSLKSDESPLPVGNWPRHHRDENR